MTRGRRPREERGAALVAALWAAVLLALIAAGVLRLAQGDALLARNRIEAAKAELAADSGVAAALHALASGDPSAWPADGAPRALAIEGAEVRVAVSDEARRIDLNRADEAALTALFREAGAGAAETRGLVSHILGRRGDEAPGEAGRRSASEAEEEGEGSPAGESRIGETRPGGPRLGEAERAGEAPAAAAPAEGDEPPAFPTLRGLLFAPGMTPALFARVEELATVYGGRASLDEEEVPAEEPEGASAPGPDGEDGAEGRQEPGETASDETRGAEGRADGGADGAAPGTAPPPPGLYRIRAEARRPGGAVAVRLGVFSVGSGRAAAVETRLWTRGPRRLFPPEG